MRLRAVLAAALLAVTTAAAARGAPAADAGRAPDADVGAIRGLFESRQFAKLTDLLEGYQASCDRDIRYEYAAHNGFAPFASGTPGDRVLLDEWVRALPGSWVPLTARATWHKASGWRARGARPAAETTDAQFRGMVDAFLPAVADLAESLRIRPRQLCAYIVLLEISQNLGDAARNGRLARKALALYPASYLVRHRYMISLSPRWGGSYEAMERFARETAPHLRANGRLAVIPGFIPWEEGRAAAAAGDYEGATASYERALSYGENWNFLYDLADCHYRAGRYDRALGVLARATAIAPQSAEGLGLLSKISLARGRFDEAMAHLEKMERIEGRRRGEPSELRRWESQRLLSEGHALLGKDPAGAIERYDLAIRVLPDSADAYCARGIAHDRAGSPGRALADLRKAIELNPRLFAAYKGLDDALYKQGRIDEIVDAWTRLLRMEPGNDNAYVERSGAYSRKRDKASQLRDLDRACGMGNNQACYLLKSLPGARAVTDGPRGQDRLFHRD